MLTCSLYVHAYAEPGQSRDWRARVLVCPGCTLPHTPSACHFRQQGAASAVLRRTRVSSQQCTSADSPQVSMYATRRGALSVCTRLQVIVFVYVRLHCYLAYVAHGCSPRWLPMHSLQHSRGVHLMHCILKLYVYLLNQQAVYLRTCFTTYVMRPPVSVIL